jgi:hypothetical protein
MTNFRKLSKSSNVVVELVSLEEARECVRDGYKVFSFNISFGNGVFYPKTKLLVREPKGSREGKTIYGVASKVLKSQREKIADIKLSDFPFYQQNKVQQNKVQQNIVQETPVYHAGLEEFISLMEELKTAGIQEETQQTVYKIALEHDVLKSLYSLAKHLSYNDWLTLAQKLESV